MDPTNQQPGQPTPPWGIDPQPDAPQPDAPQAEAEQPEAQQPLQPASPWAAPAEPTTPWGTPAAPIEPWAAAPPPDAPQPGQPTPPWAPSDQPAPWAAPGQPGTPQPYYVPGQPWPQMPQKSGGRGKRIAISAAIVIVAFIAVGVFVALRGGSVANAGKVLFSTDAPASEPQGCQVSHQVTSINATTSVYPTYIYTNTMGSDVVTLSISKDGVQLGSFAVPTADTSGADCTTDSSDLSTTLPGWGPGQWKFTLTASGKTVSEGTLTVTP
jgi:hypothetical protein